MLPEDIKVGHRYVMAEMGRRGMVREYFATITRPYTGEHHPLEPDRDWLHWTRPETYPHEHTSTRKNLARWAVREEI